MMRNILVIVSVISLVPYWRGAAHPLCYYDEKSPDPEASMAFCPQEPEGACCNEEEETAAIIVYKAASEEELTGDCADYYRQVACGPCNSFSAHLYERLSGRGPEDGMTMKQSFCDELVAACEGQITFPTYDDETYCEKHVGGTADLLWSYPIDEDAKTFVSSGLVAAFPDLSDSDIPENIICMHMTPGGDEWWMGSQDGQMVKMEVADATSTSMVLDISTGANLKRTFEEGLMDFAISPTFETTGFFYVSYTVALEDHHNRLSRFTYSEGDPDATKDSLVIILTTEAKASTIHNAGWVAFSPADYDRPTATSHEIYWTTGDGGPQTDPNNNGQNLDNLLSALIRIRVFTDSDEYESPSTNMEGGRPELCSKGLRNPFRCAFDSETSDLYCGDVGQIKVEEIDLMMCGGNYGWPRFEGSRCQEEAEAVFDEPCEGASRSGFTFPIFQYCHPDYFYTEEDAELTDGEDVCGTRAVVGNAVIMGHVYRGQRFSDALAGAVIFADAQRKNIYYLRQEGDNWVSGTIVSDQTAPVIAFSEDINGEQYVITKDGGVFQLPCGDLCSTTCLEQSEVEPTITEALGCVVDVPTDRALKVKRATGCDEGEDAMSPQICASYCETIDGATTFGVEFAYECFCGNDDIAYDRHGTLPAESCAILCTSNPDFTCGGFNAIEVYRFETGEVDDTLGSPAPVPQVPPTPSPVVVPTPSPLPLYEDFSFIGCFGDSTSRTFTGPSTSTTDMTTEICAGFCSTSQFFGTEDGTECFCSRADDVYNIRGTATCGTSCAGDSSQTCGGNFALSVYEFDDAVPGTLAPYSQPTFAPISGNYIGCFVDTPGSRLLSGNFVDDSITMTIEFCESFCDGFTYYGAEFGRQCFCGSSGLIDATEATNCDMACAGDSSQVCGGRDAISVYALPSPSPSPLVVTSPKPSPTVTYLGCYQDQRNHLLPQKNVDLDEMTNELCESLCADYVYFATQYGSECWCGNAPTYDFLGESTSCTTLCVGDPNQYCGGLFAMNVYAIIGATTPAPIPPVEAPKPTSTATYLGCYEDSSRNRIMTHMTEDLELTNEACASICATFLYYGTQFETQCWCSNAATYDSIGESTGCTVLCAGDSTQYCGGNFAMNVYENTNVLTPSPIPVTEAPQVPTPAPVVVVESPKPTSTATYLGCFEDSPRNRVMTSETTDLDLTNELCASICASFMYFGTQYGSQCWCSNAATYDSIGESTGCTFTCAGDPTEYCGGRYAMNVYEKIETLVPTPAPTPALVVVELPESTATATYIGCYQDRPQNRVMTDVTIDLDMTNELCASICASFVYFGTQYGNECWCSNAATYTSIGESTDCTFTCAGDPTEYCGGRNAMNVYEKIETLVPTPAPTPALVVVELPQPTAMATYIGCYQDRPQNRVMTDVTTDLDMTNELCASICASFVYFGTQYGSECWCSNAATYTSIGESTDCTFTCAGDPTEYCGGRNAMNVYEKIETLVPTPAPMPSVSLPMPTATATYIGCYGDSARIRVMTDVITDSGLTNEGCASTCSGFTYFGTQYGEECWCSNLVSYDQLGESTDCTMACVGDATQLCGGVYAMDVYQFSTQRRRLVAAPIPTVTYIGCYEASQEHTASKKSFHRGLTNEVCASYCAGYSFFGTRRGVECWCSNTDAHAGLSESTDCTTECPGDSAQMCGGIFAMSVHHQQ